MTTIHQYLAARLKIPPNWTQEPNTDPNTIIWTHNYAKNIIIFIDASQLNSSYLHKHAMADQLWLWAGNSETGIETMLHQADPELITKAQQFIDEYTNGSTEHNNTAVHPRQPRPGERHATNQ